MCTYGKIKLMFACKWRSTCHRSRLTQHPIYSLRLPVTYMVLRSRRRARSRLLTSFGTLFTMASWGLISLLPKLFSFSLLNETDYAYILHLLEQILALFTVATKIFWDFFLVEWSSRAKNSKPILAITCNICHLQKKSLALHGECVAFKWSL